MKERFLFGFVACLVSSLGGAQEISGAEEKFNKYYAEVRRIDGSEASAAAREVSRLYEAFYPAVSRAEGMVSASPEALHFLIRAAGAKNFYTHDAHSVSVIRSALKALESIGKSDRGDWDVYFRSLILTRDFEEARRAQAGRNDWLPAVPFIEREQEPAPGEAIVWRVDTASNTLVREGAGLSTGFHLVVVSHPACKFSRAAMHAFERDPALQGLPATWIVPPQRDLDFDLVGDWNSMHPTIPLVLTDKVSQWNFEYWSTPTFYVLKDGEPIRHRAGWALDGSDRSTMIEFMAEESEPSRQSTARH